MSCTPPIHQLHTNNLSFPLPISVCLSVSLSFSFSLSVYIVQSDADNNVCLNQHEAFTFQDIDIIMTVGSKLSITETETPQRAWDATGEKIHMQVLEKCVFASQAL